MATSLMPSDSSRPIRQWLRFLTTRIAADRARTTFRLQDGMGDARDSRYVWMFSPRMRPAVFECQGAEPQPTPGRGIGQDCTKASRSALIVSAWVVGIPCGNPLYVFSVPFCTSRADSGPESA
jgi:hypothetical protein